MIRFLFARTQTRFDAWMMCLLAVLLTLQAWLALCIVFVFGVFISIIGEGALAAQEQEKP